MKKKEKKLIEVKVFTCRACGKTTKDSDILKFFRTVDVAHPYSYEYRPREIEIYICPHCGTLRANDWGIEEKCLEYKKEEIT